MKRVSVFVVLLLLFLFAFERGFGQEKGDQDSCLAFLCECLAKGKGNFYAYHLFSTMPISFAEGDTLEYEIFLPKSNPEFKGGIDILPSDKSTSLRDILWKGKRVTDQNGLPVHGDSLLGPAVNTWHCRRIPLDALAGKTAGQWLLAFEGDLPGRYVQFIDNVAVVRAGGSREVIYENGSPQQDELSLKRGYSKASVLLPVPRGEVLGEKDLEPLISKILEKGMKLSTLRDLREDVRMVEELLKSNGQEEILVHVDAARRELQLLEEPQALEAEAFQAGIHRIHHALGHTHPVMRRYTGHLVGHAHIDFQWLWVWEETLNEIIPNTFGQAVSFMDEFKNFTFSQSSSALYAATEIHHPEIFRKIQHYVKEGRWEIVGGRVCEGDTHMISPESHARHFLYGQRFFRERFDGKQAVVGWEPDTFGHCWQMPQILRLGGCRHYYFCRGGKGIPLFWWEGPDGSRVLAFEEPATGTWYNSDLTRQQWGEVMEFEKRYGLPDLLWVYGVGNHGGGPTLEQILTALDWREKAYLPAALFSTATAFFQILEKRDLSKIPVVRDELNSDSHCGFRGCYTSHGDVKQWNRSAESLAESAEAAAAVASLAGFDYPRAAFRKYWEAITWNHHHDTLPGTSIHPSYERSRTMYEEVISGSRTIANQALEHLSRFVKGSPHGFLIFNPLGWERGGLVSVDLPLPLSSKPAVAVLPGGSRVPVQVKGKPDPGKPAEGIFSIPPIPSFGYLVVSLQNVDRLPSSGVQVSEDGSILENEHLLVEIDREKGIVKRIFQKESAREILAPGSSGGRLEIHWESPTQMSAWVIGKIERIEPLETPVSMSVIERGPVRVAISLSRPFRESLLVKEISLTAGSRQLDFKLDVEWKEKGSQNEPNPFLKVAFDLNLTHPSAVFEIPFGAILRPADGAEVPALKWGDLSEQESGESQGAWGAALLNDCKHGYSALGRTLRLSLLRCSYSPNPIPDVGRHSIRFALLPHEGDWRKGRVTKEGSEFNHPLLAAPVPPRGKGSLPDSWGLMAFDADNLVSTGLKLAEDDSDLVLRFFECHGLETEAMLESSRMIKRARRLNFMEDELGSEILKGAGIFLKVRGYEIRTLKLAPKALWKAGWEQ